MTAKQLSKECGVGHRHRTNIVILGFDFYIYADYSVEKQENSGQLYIHLDEKDSAFENTIDFCGQFKTVESLKKRVKKQLSSLAKGILK